MALIEDEKTKTKKMGLTYLYYYHENYKTASIKEKRAIREYYDEELRYKNAFYRDKKQFDKFGHPYKWETRKINRFVVSKRASDYAKGEKLFVTEPFKMYSFNLIQINISKQTDIELITVLNNYKHIHDNYSTLILKEISVMKDIMSKIDACSSTIQVNLGKNYAMYNLGYLQVIFKLQINTIIRYISVSYQTSKMVGIIALNKLEEFLRVITNLESALKNEKGEIIPQSNIFPDDFEITEIRLIQIELNKRTNLVRATIEYKFQDYSISLYELKTREVVKEA